ncbi:hypothetical protein [Aporhodopirellula aestuarii]|uniref:Uncharacterized protein n=1 Tax=Aporhodopirellula aestuarii TaxID=2950107 RepID=A0ABT0U050_9BACT|nr:hypothetical protein [Aporhodopirellula aestuarii]MCM2370212.1 hypothetical protein [Aporhodopirellula aestuarii]
MRRLFAPCRFSRSVALATALLATSAATLLPVNSLSAQEALTPGAPSDSPNAVATTTEPVVVVTIGSVNQLTQDLNYLSGALGQPQFGGMFAMMAGTFTQGVDTSQPVGILVPLVDGTPEPIALVPTSDVKTVLKRLEAQTGPADELDDGTLVVAIGANTVFIRQMGNWAVLARNRSVLDRVPADPSSVISQMGSDYDIAIRLDMQQIPAAVRDALIGQLRQGFDQAMSRQGDEAASAREYAEQSMEQLEQVISQTDDLMVGVDIDATGRRIVVDASFTAIPGTKLARVYSEQKPVPSAYSMVVRDDAAGYFHAAASISPETIETARGSIENAMKMVGTMLGQSNRLSESEINEATDVVKRLADLALSSYEEGKVDAGALLLTDAGSMKFVMGCFVADGGEAASIVKDIANKLQGRGDAPRFEFDRDTYKGVTMHLVEAEVPAKEDEVRKIFGDTVRVHIGTGEKAVYVALGDQSIDLMKEMIDGAGSPVAPSDDLARFELNLMPILQFAQSVEPNDAIASMIDALSRADDAGTLRVVSKAIDNGQRSSIVLGDGLLRAIGGAIREAQMKKMQQNNGQF